MSDILDKVSLEKFKERIKVDLNHCISYIRKQCISANEVVLTIHIGNECLKQWHDAKVNIGCTYIQIVNAVFRHQKQLLRVNDDAYRLEGRLRRACSDVKSKLSRKTGSQYRNYLGGVYDIAVLEGEIVTIADLEAELKDQKLKNDEMSKENERLKDLCDDLFEKLQQLKEAKKEVDEKLDTSCTTINNLEKENKQLYDYINKLGQNLDFSNSSGKVSEVRERQQRRKIKELKTKVERALWFAETLGLELDTVSFTDDKGGNHIISYNEKEKRAFKDLNEEDQSKIKNVLFVLDKFCIGDAAYHEMTMVPGGEGMPRSYLIKQCKNDVNKLCHVTRTPGPAEGAQVDFNSELEKVIRNQVKQGKLNTEDPDFKLKVKISGDGARMSRLTNFVVISFSVMNDEEDVMASKGNHTIAVMKGQESYELLQSSCATIFKQVNDLTKKKKVTIDGRDMSVEVFLGGDYKFLLLILGMKHATSDYACIWCTIHKQDRHDMSKPKEYYWGASFARTLQQLKDCAKSQKYSCEHQPLLEIPLDNVVLDELHLMLRVTDKLTKNLILHTLEWDKKENLNKPQSQRTDKHLQDLVKAIVSCGVSFSVWEKQDADGKGSGLYDFTSLMGSDKKLLLKHLPAKLEGVVKPDVCDTVIKIWKDFDEIYLLVSQNNPTDEQVLDFFVKARNWMNLFHSLGGRCQGHEKARATPYMHSMVYHIPKFMTLHKGIKKFTGQGVEKLNDDCRRIHLHRSNKWDAAKDVLLVEKRLENLQDYERTPRQYTKRTMDYWESTIREHRAKRSKAVTDVLENNNSVSSVDIANMTVHDIKQMLSSKGISTRLRSLKNLQELLLKTLKDNL